MKINSLFFALFFANLSFAQPASYLADLSTLRSVLQKTSSYKAQIKGDKLSAYNVLYDRLASETVSNPNSYKYFYRLAQLVFPLTDNHLGFYQVPNYNQFRTREGIDSFITSQAFKDYPTYEINIDSLQSALAVKPADSVEGIYHYDKFYTVGLFKKNEAEFVGVVLNSTVNLWQKGQVAIHLYRHAPNLYKAIYGHPYYKYFLLQPVEKYQYQSLVNSSFYASYTQAAYSKHTPGRTDYINLPAGGRKFAFKNISNNVQYLLLQSFQANDKTSLASQQFFDSIRNALTAPSLILDLRNNEGGAEKESNKYFKLLKDYVKKGRLYVLLNNNTLSRAEILTLQLKQLKNVTTAGGTTKGMLTYGSNEGKTQRLPSGHFAIYPTDMNNSLLSYEDRGIDPDVFLTDDRDWVGQVLHVIEKK